MLLMVFELYIKNMSGQGRRCDRCSKVKIMLFIYMLNDNLIFSHLTIMAINKRKDIYAYIIINLTF